jgi:hypothetical protein
MKTLASEFNLELRYIETAKITETEELYIISFKNIDSLGILRDRLNDLGYTIKNNKFHITLGEKTELIKIDALYKLISELSHQVLCHKN